MVDLQTIGVLVAAASVVAFMVNSILTSRREEKRSQLMLETRQNQLMMQVNESMTNVGFWRDVIDLMNMEWTDMDDFERKWGTGGNPEAARAIKSFQVCGAAPCLSGRDFMLSSLSN
jgi:hypothetical protein